jgi:hypothetical protein
VCLIWLAVPTEPKYFTPVALILVVVTGPRSELEFRGGIQAVFAKLVWKSGRGSNSPASLEATAH